MILVASSVSLAKCLSQYSAVRVVWCWHGGAFQLKTTIRSNKWHLIWLSTCPFQLETFTPRFWRRAGFRPVYLSAPQNEKEPHALKLNVWARFKLEKRILCSMKCKLSAQQIVYRFNVTSWRRVASSFSGIGKKGWHFHQSVDSRRSHAGFTTSVVDLAQHLLRRQQPHAGTGRRCKKVPLFDWAIELSSTAVTSRIFLYFWHHLV